MNKYQKMKEEIKKFQYSVTDKNIKRVKLNEKTRKYVQNTNSISPWLKFIYLR